MGKGKESKRWRTKLRGRKVKRRGRERRRNESRKDKGKAGKRVMKKEENRE